jgi:hypothetical protein
MTVGGVLRDIWAVGYIMTVGGVLSDMTWAVSYIMGGGQHAVQWGRVHYAVRTCASESGDVEFTRTVVRRTSFDNLVHCICKCMDQQQHGHCPKVFHRCPVPL